MFQCELSPKRKVKVQYEFIDHDEIKKVDAKNISTLKKQLGVSLDKKLIGFVGRLQRWKGTHYLLQALPKILRNNPDTTCLIVGGAHNTEPEYELELHQLAKKLKIEKNIIFCGQQNNPLEWMKVMDVFVHTSDSEPLGMVIIEAMALGKPVICTPHGGPAEIVRDGKTGFFCEPKNIALLSMKISLLLDNDELAKRIGLLGQESARKYIERTNVKKFIKNINSLLDG
jgi:glycosyltransferase involved in cell wall biosynthesis